MKKKIYTQGTLDGACFIYSLANAYYALTGEIITPMKWERCVNASPLSMQDFMTRRGTTKLDGDPRWYEIACETFLAPSGKKFSASYVSYTSYEKLKASISRSSVIILLVDKESHWLTAVDAADKQIFAACSYENHNAATVEAISPRFARRFNRSGSLSDFQCGKSPIGVQVNLKK